MKKIILFLMVTFCVFLVNAQNIDRAGISAGGLNDNMLNATIGQIFDVSMNSDEISIDFGTFSDTTFIGGKILNPDTIKVEVSVKEIFDFETKNVTCYPNPVKDVLNVDLTGTEKISKITVSDIYGKQILNFSPEQNEKIGLNVQTLPPGTYILYFGSTIDKGLTPIKFIKINN